MKNLLNLLLPGHKQPMCLDGAFKLCSCDADALPESEIGWVLDVNDGSKQGRSRKGKCFMPKYSAAQTATMFSVATELNSRNCFDFELSGDPAVKYRLRVRAGTSGPWLPFRRFDGTWSKDGSHQFSDWRAGLERDRQGSITPEDLSAGKSGASAVESATPGNLGMIVAFRDTDGDKIEFRQDFCLDGATQRSCVSEWVNGKLELSDVDDLEIDQDQGSLRDAGGTMVLPPGQVPSIVSALRTLFAAAGKGSVLRDSGSGGGAGDVLASAVQDQAMVHVQYMDGRGVLQSVAFTVVPFLSSFRPSNPALYLQDMDGDRVEFRVGVSSESGAATISETVNGKLDIDDLDVIIFTAAACTLTDRSGFMTLPRNEAEEIWLLLCRLFTGAGKASCLREVRGAVPTDAQPGGPADSNGALQ